MSNTTQNKEELNKEQKKCEFGDCKKRAKYHECGWDLCFEHVLRIYGISSRGITIVKKILDKSILQAHQSGIEEGAEAERKRIKDLMGDEIDDMENNASFYLKLAESLKENKQ